LSGELFSLKRQGLIRRIVQTQLLFRCHNVSGARWNRDKSGSKKDLEIKELETFVIYNYEKAGPLPEESVCVWPLSAAPFP
jgi:hypothetical protein